MDGLLVALAGLALGLLVFGPALGQLQGRFLGIDYVDHHGTQWFYWLAERSLRQGGSPLHTDLSFHPWGKDVLAHTGANLLDAYLAVPFRLLWGPVLGYNLFVLAGLLGQGLAFTLLARQVAGDRLSIGVGALLSALLPFALFEAMEGRPTQGLLALPTLFLAALLRTGRGPGLKAPLAAGLLLALCGYQYWYYAFFGGMVALAHGLALALRPPEGSGGARRLLLRHALVALVALLLVLPLALPLALALDEVPGLLDVESWSLSGAPPSVDEDMRVGLLLWEPLRGATGFFLHDPGGARVFLARTSWTPLVLVAVLPLALWWRTRLPRGPWLAMVATAALLAIGPVLIVGQWGLPNPFYIALVKLLTPLQRLWWPGRAYAFLGLLLALAAVAALAALRLRIGPGAQRGLALLLLVGQGAHLQAQGLLPFPTWDATVPAGYRCLAHGPPGAIIELPYSWTQAHLYYQTAHGRPMLGGMIENNVLFTPAELTALRQDNALVARLIGLPGGGAPQPFVPDPQDLTELLDLGYRYVVLQEDALVIGGGARSRLDNAVRTRARELRRALVELMGPPVYDDARVSIYTLDGGGSPCAGVEIPPDTVALGRGAPGAGDLVDWNPEQVEIRWVFAEEEDTGAEEEAGRDPRRFLWGEDPAE